MKDRERFEALLTGLGYGRAEGGSAVRRKPRATRTVAKAAGKRPRGAASQKLAENAGEIKRRFLAGKETNRAIAKGYGVSDVTLGAFIKARGWKRPRAKRGPTPKVKRLPRGVSGEDLEA